MLPLHSNVWSASWSLCPIYDSFPLTVSMFPNASSACDIVLLIKWQVWAISLYSSPDSSFVSCVSSYPWFSLLKPHTSELSPPADPRNCSFPKINLTVGQKANNYTSEDSKSLSLSSLKIRLSSDEPEFYWLWLTKGASQPYIPVSLASREINLCRSSYPGSFLSERRLNKLFGFPQFLFLCLMFYFWFC